MNSGKPRGWAATLKPPSQNRNIGVQFRMGPRRHSKSMNFRFFNIFIFIFYNVFFIKFINIDFHLFSMWLSFILFLLHHLCFCYIYYYYYYFIILSLYHLCTWLLLSLRYYSYYFCLPCLSCLYIISYFCLFRLFLIF